MSLNGRIDRLEATAAGRGLASAGADLARLELLTGHQELDGALLLQG